MLHRILSPADAPSASAAGPSFHGGDRARTRSLPRPPGKRAFVEHVIEERLGSAMLTVANLCRWTGISRSSLYRIFEGDGGVQAYIRARRLVRVAAELRSTTVQPMATLAEQWGFCDAAYLARLFRDTHGMTPTAYRAFHRG